jgi:hypothetical protein
MRIVPILTAAAIGLVASYGLASAQATNVAPQSGTAKTLSGAGTDTMTNQKAMGQKAKSQKVVSQKAKSQKAMSQKNMGLKAMAKGKKIKKKSAKRM